MMHVNDVVYDDYVARARYGYAERLRAYAADMPAMFAVATYVYRDMLQACHAFRYYADAAIFRRRCDRCYAQCCDAV